MTGRQAAGHGFTYSFVLRYPPGTACPHHPGEPVSSPLRDGYGVAFLFERPGVVVAVASSEGPAPVESYAFVWLLAADAGADAYRIQDKDPNQERSLPMSYPSASNSIPAKQLSPVDEAFTRLEHQLGNLEERVSAMADRLTPLILPTPEPTASDAIPGDPPVSALVSRLMSAERRVACANERIQKMLGGLQL